MGLSTQMTHLIASCYSDAVAVPPAGTAVQLVIPANPKRLYLQVWSLGGLTTCGILLPDANVIASIGTVQMVSGTSWKFHDCPTLTTGEWYGKGTIIDGWVYIEECYNGD